ncbi:MAG: radical SAM protein [Candidatus Omnitrophica bacterium]|nr:radical SAM protein [Candidatus Omnitrophota bacterium]
MKINKILLINPPYYIAKSQMNYWPSFPLGMGYIAAYLEKKGYSVQIIDAFGEGYNNKVAHGENHFCVGLSYSEIISKISDYAPDIIGISNLFSAQHYSMHSMAKVIKCHDNTIPVVVGGPHVSAVPELVMMDSNIDYGILGEGEYVFFELISALNNARDLKEVAGIAYRDNGAIRLNRPQEFIEKLDQIPYPAWHLFKMDKYLYQKMSHGGSVKRHPFMTMLTSRGCPYNCFFCSVRDTWGRNLRTRSLDNVIGEITLLREKFGVKELIIVDDNFNFDTDRLHGILDYLIKKRMDLTFEIPNGLFIKKLDEAILAKMKAAGVKRIFFPIESGNEHVRNNIIKKPLDIEAVKELVAYCRKINLESCAYFIVGLPEETRKQIEDTFQLARKLKIMCYFSVATPFPGSALYNYVKEKGLLRSYEIEQCSDEYNILGSDWSADELRKMVFYESLKINYKAKLLTCLKEPFSIPGRACKYLNKNIFYKT